MANPIGFVRKGKQVIDELNLQRAKNFDKEQNRLNLHDELGTTTEELGASENQMAYDRDRVDALMEAYPGLGDVFGRGNKEREWIRQDLNLTDELHTIKNLERYPLLHPKSTLPKDNVRDMLRDELDSGLNPLRQRLDAQGVLDADAPREDYLKALDAFPSGDAFAQRIAKKYRTNTTPEETRELFRSFYERLERLDESQDKVKGLRGKAQQIQHEIDNLALALGIPASTLTAEMGLEQPSEIKRIEDEYALSDQAIMDKYLGSGLESTYQANPRDPVTHTGSYDQTGDVPPQEIKAHPDWPMPEEDRWDQVGNRLLAMREGIAAIPGDWADIAGFLTYSPLLGAMGTEMADQPVPKALFDAGERARQKYMSNPEYEARDWDEGVGHWGARIGLDPLSWVGTSATKAGPVISKTAPKQLPRVNPGPIDPSRRKFMQDTGATAAVGGIGGLVGLRAMTKGGPEAVAHAKEAPKVLDMMDWIYKAKRPRNYPAEYMGDGRIYAAGKDVAGHNNYMRSMYKEFKEALGAKEVAKMEKIAEDVHIPWRILVRDAPEEIPEIYKKYKLNPDIAPETYRDLGRVIRARKVHKQQMDAIESQLDEAAGWYSRSVKDSDEIFDAYKAIQAKNINSNTYQTPPLRLKDIYKMRKWAREERARAAFLNPTKK